MPRFSANLSMMFQEHDFPDRFQAASDAGFKAVEFLFPYDFPAKSIGSTVSSLNLAISVFNLRPGQWDAGERGLATLHGRENEFRESVDLALDYATALGAKRLHVMAGIAPVNRKSEDKFIENILYAAELFARAGLELLIEPINSRDMPGYFLSTVEQASALLKRIDKKNVRIQFDVYHHQITRGDVIRSLEKYMPEIGHVQIAGVPERHEPDTGELNYPAVFNALDSLGYEGWIGCEYRPAAGTKKGLNWFQQYK